MQLYTLDGVIGFLIRAFYSGFIMYCSVCLVLRIFPFKIVKQEATNIQASSNLIMAFGVLLDIPSWGVLFYEAYSDQVNYEWVLNSPYSIFTVSKVLFWIIGLLFFFRKFRKSWLLSLLALFFSNLDSIVSFLSRYWRDYLPSSWSTYYDFYWYHYLIEVFIFSLFVLVCYLILAKRKKLPFDSSWIR